MQWTVTEEVHQTNRAPGEPWWKETGRATFSSESMALMFLQGLPEQFISKGYTVIITDILVAIRKPFGEMVRRFYLTCT